MSHWIWRCRGYRGVWLSYKHPIPCPHNCNHPISLLSTHKPCPLWGWSWRGKVICVVCVRSVWDEYGKNLSFLAQISIFRARLESKSMHYICHLNLLATPPFLHRILPGCCLGYMIGLKYERLAITTWPRPSIWWDHVANRTCLIPCREQAFQSNCMPQLFW